MDRGEGATARCWSYVDGRGGIGVIASITEPFCDDCNRLRVTADGQAFTCLFAAQGTDLKPVRNNVEDLQQRIVDLWSHRDDRYSEERHGDAVRPPHAEMAYLGG